LSSVSAPVFFWILYAARGLAIAVPGVTVGGGVSARSAGRDREPAEEPQADLAAYSFLATSGPVMRRSSGMVEAIMPRLTAMPAPVTT